MQMIRIFAAIVFFEMVSLSFSSCRENIDERKLEQKPTEQSSVGEIIISHRKRAQWSAFEHEVWPHWHQPNHYCVASSRTVHNAPMWSWMLDGISQCLSSVFSFARLYIPFRVLCSVDTQSERICLLQRMESNSPHFLTTIFPNAFHPFIADDSEC